MNSKLSYNLQRNWWWLAFTFLLVMGVLLRVYKYWEFPIAGETKDEIAWSMLGRSLMQTGVPRSWSYFEGYANTTSLTGDSGETYRLVAPALDHPPLFSLLPGTVLTLTNHEWSAIPSMKVARAPLILLSVINLLIAAYWFYLLWGRAARTMFGVFFMATLPSIIWTSRLVVSENLLVTWWLIAGISIMSRQKSWSKYALFVAQMAAPVTKIAGLALAAGVAVSTYSTSKKKLWPTSIFGAAVGVISVLAYAAKYDWSLFWEIQRQQSQRDTGWLSWWQYLWQNNALVSDTTSALWPILLIAIYLGWLLWRQPTSTSPVWWRYLQWTGLAMMAFLAVSVGEHTVHGWYRLVLFPVGVTALADVLGEIWQRRHWMGWSLLAIVGTGTMRWAWLLGNAAAYRTSANASRMWWLCIGIIAALSLVSMPEKRAKQWQSVVVSGLFGILLLSHVWSVWHMDQQTYWQDSAYWDYRILP